MFQKVSVVNGIYCNATVDSVGQENTLIIVSHNEHDFCLSLSPRCNLDSDRVVWLILSGHVSREPPRDM